MGNSSMNGAEDISEDKFVSMRHRNCIEDGRKRNCLVWKIAVTSGTEQNS